MPPFRRSPEALADPGFFIAQIHLDISGRALYIDWMIRSDET
jgi:hypothetical protein